MEGGGNVNAVADIVDKVGILYYITMMKFERKEREKRKKRAITRRVSPTEKIQLIQEYRDEWTNIFQFKEIQKEMKPQNLHIESYQELYQLLSHIDIGKCFSPAIPTNKFFDCYLFKGNTAWISITTKGHYRYYSKKRKSGTVSFDFLDLIEIYYGVPTYEAIDKIVRSFSICFMEDVWKKTLQNKYKRNEDFIIDRLPHYPHVFALLSENARLLNTLNILGNFHIYKKEYQYKDQNVFFASGSHIAHFLETSNVSKVNQFINLFSVLGLIEKVPSFHIHPVFLKESTDIVDRRNLGNRINYYIVHDFEKVMATAEKRAELLVRHGVRYSNMSKATIEKIFGSSFAEAIYVQTVQKNKKQVNKQRSTIEKRLEAHFQRALNEMGYVTKSTILSMPLPDIEPKQAKNYLNQIWGYLMETYQCSYKKPTKKVKQELELDSFEYIARKEKPNI